LSLNAVGTFFSQAIVTTIPVLTIGTDCALTAVATISTISIAAISFYALVSIRTQPIFF
jgi:hypothetical protein